MFSFLFPNNKPKEETDSKHEKTALSRNTKGLEYLRDRNYAEAIKCFSEAVALNPKSANFRCNRAFVHKALDQFEEALCEYDTAIVLDPGHLHALADRAHLLVRLNRHEKLLRELDDAIRTDDCNHAAYLGRAALRVAMGNFDIALQDIDRATSLYPACAHYEIARGELLFRMRRYDEAVSCLRKAAATADLDYQSMVFYNLALTQKALGQHDEASRLLKEACRINPYYKRVGLVWCSFCGVSQPNAHEFVQKAPHAICNVCVHSLIAKAEQKAAMSTPPAELSYAHCNFCDLNVETDWIFGEVVKICSDCLGTSQMAIGEEITAAPPPSQRSFDLILSGKFQEAVEACNIVIQMNPQFAIGYNNRARALLELKRYEEALADAEHATILNPEQNGVFYQNRGWALKELGRLDEALKSLSQALALDPELERSYEVRAATYDLLNQPDLAAQDRKKAKEIKDRPPPNVGP